METQYNTVILCGGKINYSNLPIGSNLSNAMIPVNGKPVIAWIVDELLKKEIMEATIVLLKDNFKLKEFLTRTISRKIKLRLVELEESTSILFSLLKGIEGCKTGGITRLILGDTLIRDDYYLDIDFLYIQPVIDSERWCIAKVNDFNFVEKYYDKQHNVPSPHYAVCGYYHFADYSHLNDCVVKCIELGKTQLSDLLHLYGQKKPIKAIVAQSWYDFGNIDNFITAKKNLLQSRFFNSLTIDPVLNTITKVSILDEKLRDELEWYKLIPYELKVLTPRIIREEIIEEKLNLMQEYYGYPTLAELFLYSDLNVDAWTSIIRKVFQIQQVFQQYTVTLKKEDLFYMYYQKTILRIEQTKKDEEWRSFLNTNYISVNGKMLKNLPLLIADIEIKIKQLLNFNKGCIVHGDLCFSNILFDINNQIIRLIDPRGSFGAKGIYGDPRYDIAKLRHSVCGLYDFIVSDLFEIQYSDEGVNLEIFHQDYIDEIAKNFDDLTREFGFDPEEIIFIEGLLFISMIPLHMDYPNRQKAMFIRGLQYLNKYENSN